MPTTDSFDALSHRWQQQPLAPTPPAADWQALLARDSRGPVEQMLRHTWAELLAGTPLTGLLLAGLLHQPGPLAHLLAGGVGGLGALTLLYYYRQLSLLRRLRLATDPLRQHAAGQLRQLRDLLRLGLGANLGLTVLLAALLLWASQLWVLPLLPVAGVHNFFAWFGLTVVASLGLVYWLARYHLRTAYGQHLDRLEAVLRELDAA